jgi:hypothetical protein
MVKQITVIPVNDTIVEPESTPEQVEEIIKVEEEDEPRQSRALTSNEVEPQLEEHIIKLEDDITKETYEINTVEKVDEKPKTVKT